MTLKRYLFEGGSQGTAVTPQNIGASQVVLGGGTMIFDAAAGKNGLGIKATNLQNAQCLARFTPATTDTDMLISLVVTSLPAVPSDFVWFYTLRGGVVVKFAFGYAGGVQKLYLFDGSNTQIELMTVTPSTKYKIKGKLAAGASITNGSYSINVYAANGTTPLNAQPFVRTDVNTGTSAFTGADGGIVNLPPNSYSILLDEIAFDDDTSGGEIPDYVPGANAAPTVTAPAVQTVAPGATVSVAFNEADSDGTIASRTTGFDFPTVSPPAISNTATASFTAGPAGSLYLIRRVVTDNAGTPSAPAIAEVRVAQAGELRPLAKAPEAIGAWTHVGGSTPAVLADESNGTYIDSGPLTTTETVYECRFQPSVNRSLGTVSFVVDKYNPADPAAAPGNAALTARLYLQATGGTAIDTFDVPLTTSIATVTHDLTPAAITAITNANAWSGPLYIALGAKQQ